MKLELDRRYFKLGYTKNIGLKKRAIANNEIYQYLSKNLRKDEKIICPCGSKKSYTISTIDRYGFYYPLNICENCGLIFGKNYWNSKQLEIFYEKFYRKIYSYNVGESNTDINLNRAHDNLSNISKVIYDLAINFFKKDQLINVVDLGGGTGGVLSEFKKHNHNCTIVEQTPSLIEFASKKGYNAMEGNIQNINFKNLSYDLIILNHVLEHIPDIKNVLTKIKTIMHANSLLWIALPGLDSLKDGRRRYDFLEDIHDAHLYYFTSKNLNYLLSINDFKCVYIDNEIKSLFRRSDEKPITNNKLYEYTVTVLKKSEFKRKYINPILSPLKNIFRPLYLSLKRLVSFRN